VLRKNPYKGKKESIQREERIHPEGLWNGTRIKEKRQLIPRRVCVKKRKNMSLCHV